VAGNNKVLALSHMASSSYLFGQKLILIDFYSGIDFVDEVKGSVKSNCSSKQPKGDDHHKRVRKVK